MTTLYGAEASSFTGKVRAYLRWAGISFDEISANAEVYREVILPAVGVPVIPVLRHNDGRMLHDSTLIINTLNAERIRTGGISVYPLTPLRKLVALMLEAYGDEWLIIPAMHFRWSDDKHWAIEQFGALNAPGETAKKQREIGRKLAVPFTTSAGRLGATPDMVPAVEDSYGALLAELDTHFEHSTALLGSQATMADFGLIGPLYAHLYRDPTSGEFMRDMAPNVARWVDLVQFHPDRLRMPLNESDHIPGTLIPVLKRLAREQLPVMVDTVAPVRSWIAAHPGEPLPRALGKHAFELEGQHGERMIRPYSLWMMQRIRDHLLSLMGEERERVDEFLRSIGAEALIDFPDPPRLEPFQLTVRPVN